MSESEMTQPRKLPERRSARGILLDAAGRVLLIRFAVERSGRPFVFWATPGGAIEAGETEVDAARRELREELGLDIALTGPVHDAESEFEFEGERIRSIDVYFVGRCDVPAPALRFATEGERKAMKVVRWWSVAEIEGTGETIFPTELAAIVRSEWPLQPRDL